MTGWRRINHHCGKKGSPMKHSGGRVLAAGMIVNFFLGTSYAWSVLAAGFIAEKGWSRAEASLPHAVGIFVFALMMLAAGRYQDSAGPRRSVMISGALAGAACLFCALRPTPGAVTASFGLLYGSAIAFGYGSVTPAVLSWFSPERRGAVTGAVIASTGAAALVLAPLLNLLIGKFGLQSTLLLWGLILAAVLFSASLFMAVASHAPSGGEAVPGKAAALEFSWLDMIRRPPFALLWSIMALSTGVGVFLNVQMVQIARLDFGVDWGYLMISLYAVFNTLGRLGGGLLCDRLGYVRGIRLAVTLQGAAMALLLAFRAPAFLGLAAVLTGTGYGSLYTFFPAAVVGRYGLRHFGLNYGLLFTAVAAGGLIPFAAGLLADGTGSFAGAFAFGAAASMFILYLTSHLPRFDAFSTPAQAPRKKSSQQSSC